MGEKQKKSKVEIKEGFPELGENFVLILHPEPLDLPHFRGHQVRPLGCRLRLYPGRVNAVR